MLEIVNESLFYIFEIQEILVAMASLEELEEQGQRAHLVITDLMDFLV